MGIGNINSNYTFSFAVPYVDSEEKEIAARLLAYGITPTGDKSTDRAKLKRIELEKAKQETTISSNKFITVSASEQEKIQDKKQGNKETAGIGFDAMANYNKAFIKSKWY